MIVASYGSNGVLNRGFGESGVAHTDVRGGDDFADDLVVDSAGRILVVGRATSPTIFDMALVCFEADGTLRPAARDQRPSRSCIQRDSAVAQPSALSPRYSESSNPAARGRSNRCAETAPLPRTRSLPLCFWSWSNAKAASTGAGGGRSGACYGSCRSLHFWLSPPR
jgi:hypothetical protein